ncbi:MAG: thiamine phosphate synthase [Candidatus Omnitrophica bacterium]|nr:thiamine phosphate synthase [Candidatus Omnitrophota bacterium]
MSWKKKVFENFRLYAVTDLREADPSIFKKVEEAYRGGADIVQLRSKTLTDGELFRIGLRMRKVAHRFQKLFFVNDRPDLALALEADGVHLGQDDLPIAQVRRLLKGKQIFIGKSTHSLAQALQAVQEGVDYIGVGPIFETPTKPTYQAVGIELVKRVSKRVRIPFVCIGGVDQGNLKQVVEAGAKRIAVVRAIFGAKDVYVATKKLREVLED